MVDVKFSQFFDRQRVIDKVSEAKRRVLSKAGAFVMTRARTSIRKGPKKRPYIAEPGKPPRSWRGLLKQFIFFGYDDNTDSVVIGPQLLNGSRNTAKRGGITVPQLLEEGGMGVNWRTKRPARYHAFPYMQPALAAESDRFHQMFADAVK